MKKNIVITLSVIFILVLSSCNSSNIDKEKKEVKVVIPKNVVLSDTGLLTIKNDESSLFEGLLELSDLDGFKYVLYSNYTSRSRTSYYVNEELSSQDAYKQLENKVGQVIEVKGIITNDKGIWTKEIKIKELM